MKVLVTGSSGFLGQWVCSTLRNDDVLAIAFDRYDRYDIAPDTSFFLGDITDPTSVTEAMAHVDGWIHLAGVLGTAETIQNPIPAAQTNILGGLNVFQAAAQYKVPGVNIAVGNYWFNNTYSITKNTMESFAHMYNNERGTQITVVRALNAYGPGQVSAPPYGPSKVKKIGPAFINAAIRDLPIEIYGTGDNIMDMVYAKDVAKALCEALYITMDNGAIHSPIEIGTGRATTVNEIAQAVIDVSRSKSEIVHLPMRAGEKENEIVLADPNTLRNIGMFPGDLTRLEKGLVPTIDWFKFNAQDLAR